MTGGAAGAFERLRWVIGMAAPELSREQYEQAHRDLDFLDHAISAWKEEEKDWYAERERQFGYRIRKAISALRSWRLS